MAIVDVKEELKKTIAQVGTDGATDVRVFTVKFDTADDPLKRRLIALFAKDPSTGLRIPSVYQSHPYDHWLYVKNKYARPKGPFLYEVTVNYTVASSDQRVSEETNPFVNPLDQEPEVSWGFAASNERIDRDINGKPIVNTAGQSFDPPITEEFYDLVLRIVRNEESYNHKLASQCVGAVNDDLFYGFEKGLVKCTRFDGDKRRAVDLIYYQVYYEFQIRVQEWQGINEGWKRRILDEGTHFWKDEKVDDDDYPILETFKDKDGIPGGTFPLNGEGDLLPGEDYINKNFKFLLFETKRKLPFSVLKL